MPESLSENWRDKDSIILHANFQLLKDFVEQENPFSGQINWGADEKSRQAKQEIQDLYQWWLSYYEKEGDLPQADRYELENNMLHRLISIRWALWT